VDQAQRRRAEHRHDSVAQLPVVPSFHVYVIIPIAPAEFGQPDILGS
jgi:hypothetical protein